jgi:hypothetical protein
VKEGRKTKEEKKRVRQGPNPISYSGTAGGIHLAPSSPPASISLFYFLFWQRRGPFSYEQGVRSSPAPAAPSYTQQSLTAPWKQLFRGLLVARALYAQDQDSRIYIGPHFCRIVDFNKDNQERIILHSCLTYPFRLHEPLGSDE